MKQDIKERIEKIQKGEVPEGYQKTKVGIIPEDWKNPSLKKAVIFLDSKRKPIEAKERANIKGIYPYYGASGIIDYVNDYLFDDELILLGEDGANIIMRSTPLAFKISGKTWVNNHAHVLKPNNDMDIDFLTEMLESKNYRKYNTGTAQPKLNNDVCKNIIVKKPPYDEQKKIGNIILTWDKAIELKEKLIEEKKEFKRGLMQKLLTGKIRFPEFTTEWRTAIIKDVFGEVKRINGNNSKDIDILTISAKHGFLSQNDKFNRVIAGSSLKKYTHLFQNEFAYNKGNSKTAPFGCIFKLDIKEGLVPFVYICFRPTQMIDVDFFDFYFKHGLLDRQLKRIITSGARSDGLLNVSKDNFFNMKISLPSIEEQKKIGFVLRLIQNEIDNSITELNQLKEQKRGLMQLLLTGIVRVEVD